MKTTTPAPSQKEKILAELAAIEAAERAASELQARHDAVRNAVATARKTLAASKDAQALLASRASEAMAELEACTISPTEFFDAGPMHVGNFVAHESHLVKFRTANFLKWMADGYETRFHRLAERALADAETRLADFERNPK